MQVTVVTWDDRTVSVEVDPNESLTNMMAILEAETGIPVQQQQLILNGRTLPPNSTARACGIENGDLLMLIPNQASSQPRPHQAPGPPPAMQMLPDGSAAHPSDLISQMRTNAELMAGLRVNNPRMADIIQANDVEALQTELRRIHRARTEAATRDAEMRNADPLDPEVQRRIEEEIQQKNIEENLAQALEHAPEVFGQVHMLYVDMEVNGVHVKTFIDSGAQMTIMTYEFTQRCYLTRLIDKRFEGIAKGVGTSKIIGRIHQAPVRVGGHFITSSITVLEQKDGPQFIFGLDNMRRHQCKIDLQDNCLYVGTCGAALPFLAEHQIPQDYREHLEDVSEAEAKAAVSTEGTTSSTPPAAGRAPPTAAPAPSQPPPQPTPSPVTQSMPASGLMPDQEQKVAGLMALGFPRDQVLQALQLTGWREEEAGAYLFD